MHNLTLKCPYCSEYRVINRFATLENDIAMYLTHLVLAHRPVIDKTLEIASTLSGEWDWRTTEIP